MKNTFRHTVFWIPFGFLLICSFLSFFYKDSFFGQVEIVNQWILTHFDWAFTWTSFACVILVLVILFSPFAKTKIGGKEAKPLLSKWKWFSITLCTTVATGILFWGVAEPLYHLHDPPENLSGGSSDQLRQFAMSTLYMHWTLTPYSIYTVMGLLFALCFYNLKQPFNLGTFLYPIFKSKAYGLPGTITDILCLFALVAGMAASLGSGILSISGGLNKFFGIPGTVWTYAAIAFTIVAAFSISAGSGLMKGIRILSDLNARAFVILSLFVLAFGPTRDMFLIGWEGLTDYFLHFFQRSTNVVEPLEKSWQHSWTTFYWANWMAWAPISALFLGRISYGYSIRSYILVNLLFTSTFGALWMIIFGGSALHFDGAEQTAPLYSILSNGGPEDVAYALFEYLPLAKIVSLFFLLIVFTSYVTAADSNTSAMSGICTYGISPTNAEAPLFVKLAWGSIIGFVSWTMISYADIEGIKLISTLGGFSALFLTILAVVGLGKIILQNKKYFENNN